MPPKRNTSAKNPRTSNKKPEVPQAGTSKDGETPSGLSQEAEDQFELELCWCIQHLETCLTSGKLQDKQAHDLGKNINILKSSTAPLIKKRQVMRNTLGNYREKMAMDEQKHSKAATSVKFASPSGPNKKFVFLRKAACHSSQAKENCARLQSTTNEDTNVQEPFKFNFQIVE